MNSQDNVVAHTRLETPRLRLMPETAEMCAAIADRPRLAQLLQATLAEGWPTLDSLDVAPLFEEALRANPEELGWGGWIFVLRHGEIAVGDGGFHGPAEPDGTVEIGYGMAPEWQGHGLATEGARILVEWAFSHPWVTRLVAREVLADNFASHRVLIKCGFRETGRTPDTSDWELLRSDAENGSSVHSQGWDA